MTDADLQLIDMHPADPFDFYSAKYETQLVAGYSKNTRAARSSDLHARLQLAREVIHSCISVRAGSMRAARRAGRYAESIAMVSSPIVTAAYVCGVEGADPVEERRDARVRRRARPRCPRPRPPARSRQPWRTTSAMTWRGSAPSAIRTPISFECAGSPGTRSPRRARPPRAPSANNPQQATSDAVEPLGPERFFDVRSQRHRLKHRHVRVQAANLTASRPRPGAPASNRPGR